MAKYDINYACGHGSYEEQLFGKNDERHRKIAWLEKNKVCPACYKDKKAAEDAAAPKAAKIHLVMTGHPQIAIEVTGQIAANKEALYAIGYQWMDSAEGGLMAWMTATHTKRALAKHTAPTSIDALNAWIAAERAALAALGYSLQADLSLLDVEMLRRAFAAQTAAATAKDNARAALAAIKAADPRPEPAPLRKRITELEKKTGATWNGKIYGRKGSWNFYVNNEQYRATDAEVAEREESLKAMTAWDAKYAAEIAAAKAAK